MNPAYQPRTVSEHESRLSELRIQQGLTYRQLEKMTGVRKEIIACLSTGSACPLDRYGSLSRSAELICLALDATPEEVFPRYFCRLADDETVSLDNLTTCYLYSEATAYTLTAPAEDRAAKMELISRAVACATSPRQRTLLKMRLEGSTLDEVGQLLNLTRERVRQIESKIINKLRRAGQ